MMALDVNGVLFNEEGYIMQANRSLNEEGIAEACKIAAQMMPEIRKARREFRARMREEIKKAEEDPRVPKPTSRHSSFWQNGGSTLRREIPRLKEMGYTSAHLWVPMCQQEGADTFGWLLWPPVVPREENYLFQRAKALDEVLSGTKGWACDTKDLVSRVTPEGITYAGYLRMVSPSGSATASTGIKVLVTQ